MGTARRDIAQQSTKMPEAPSWGFYYAACGDILKLHDYLCHPNAPNQTTGEALVNNQLDSADDLMPSKKYIEQHRLETSSSEMFRRGEAEGGIPVWWHKKDGWQALYGDTCLHLALRNKQIEAARLILKKGTNNTPEVKNSLGHTPADTAAQAGVPWPLPEPLVDLTVTDVRLVRESGCRGCMFTGTMFGSAQHWQYGVLVKRPNDGPDMNGSAVAPTEQTIWHRYSDFVKLREALLADMDPSHIDLCLLPSAATAMMFDAQCQADLYERIQSLDEFMQRLAFEPDVLAHVAFGNFCGTGAITPRAWAGVAPASVKSLSIDSGVDTPRF